MGGGGAENVRRKEEKTKKLTLDQIYLGSLLVDNMPALRAEGTPGIDSQRNHIPLMAPPLWQPVSVTSHIANFPIVERISHSIINIILTKK